RLVHQIARDPRCLTAAISPALFRQNSSLRYGLAILLTAPQGPRQLADHRLNKTEAKMAANPIPQGYHTITPYLVVRAAAETIEFAKNAFGAALIGEPTKRPDGTLMHAEITIGDSRVMIAEATQQSPPMPAMLYLYVPNVDAVYQRAIKAGGKSVMEP